VQLAHCVYTYVTRGEYPSWYYENLILIEFGLARFKGKQVTIEEPLALVSIMRFFKDHNTTIEHIVRARFQDDKGKAFEEAVLLAITTQLQNSRILKDVFKFHGVVPSWARRTAQVVVRDRQGSFRPFDVAAHQPLVPSDGVAFCARDPEDLKQWIKGEHQAGWCVPGPLMGPDLMTWIKLDNGRYLLLMIQVKCHFTGNRDTLRAEVTADAVKSLVPARFFASVVCLQPSTYPTFC
jgi:hypothetical protein